MKQLFTWKKNLRDKEYKFKIHLTGDLAINDTEFSWHDIPEIYREEVIEAFQNALEMSVMDGVASVVKDDEYMKKVRWAYNVYFFSNQKLFSEKKYIDKVSHRTGLSPEAVRHLLNSNFAILKP